MQDPTDVICQAAARHYFACKKSGIRPEPRYIPEWIHDERSKPFMAKGAAAGQ